MYNRITFPHTKIKPIIIPINYLSIFQKSEENEMKSNNV